MTRRQRGLLWRWAAMAAVLGFMVYLASWSLPVLKLFALLCMPFAIFLDKSVPSAETPGELLEDAADRHPIIRVFFVIIAIGALAAVWISSHSSIRWMDVIGESGVMAIVFSIFMPVVIVSEYRRWVAYGKEEELRSW